MKRTKKTNANKKPAKKPFTREEAEELRRKAIEFSALMAAMKAAM